MTSCTDIADRLAKFIANEVRPRAARAGIPLRAVIAPADAALLMLAESEGAITRRQTRQLLDQHQARQ